MQLDRVTKDQVPFLTDLLNRAYAPWTAMGFGSTFTEEKASKFLLADGYTITRDERIAGVVCMRAVTPTVDGHTISVEGPHKIYAAELLHPTATSRISEKSFLYFYSLAVEPALSKQGIGSAAIKLLHDRARQQNLHGLLLETGKEAEWLVNWYTKLGFRVIAEKLISGGLHTVFMLKDL